LFFPSLRVVPISAVKSRMTNHERSELLLVLSDSLDLTGVVSRPNWLAGIDLFWSVRLVLMLNARLSLAVSRLPWTDVTVVRGDVGPINCS
jgi:hypothetical protein